LFLILSLLHLGDVKQAVGNELDRLERGGIASVEYRGEDPALAGTTYTLDELRLIRPGLQNDILGTRAGFGGEKLPAPQASLMAIVARSIVEAKTEFILIIAGMLMGAAFIMMQVRSPMLIAVGMYLPIDTSFAIFVGGLMKGLLDRLAEKRAMEPGARERMGNAGVLLSSGLIAGEALLGLLFAGLAFAEVRLLHIFDSPSYLLSLVCIAILGIMLVRMPLRSVGK
ncbi:MAG: OPT/YSL family transporter, partial [Candidatus Krumholzibacteria bacterium]|nr:OPT/YSL family transporter [Candidatus Krumholzibacteria bacterium]